MSTKPPFKDAAVKKMWPESLILTGLFALVLAMMFGIAATVFPHKRTGTPDDRAMETIHPGDIEQWKQWQEAQNRHMLREIEKLQAKLAAPAQVVNAN